MVCTCTLSRIHSAVNFFRASITAGPSSSRLGEQGLQENKPHARLSPRLGVAFPVDERTVPLFNYGQFYQQPNLQDLYVNYRFLDYKVRSLGCLDPSHHRPSSPLCRFFFFKQKTAYEI